jgi:hypothetical protein
MSGESALNSYYRMRGIRRGQEEFDKTAVHTEGVRRRFNELEETAQPVKIRQIAYESRANDRADELAGVAHPNDLRGEEMRGTEQAHVQSMRGITNPNDLANATTTAATDAIKRPQMIPNAESQVRVDQLTNPENERQATMAPTMNQSAEQTTLSQNRATQSDNALGSLQNERATKEEQFFQKNQDREFARMSEFETVFNGYMDGFAKTGNPNYIMDAYKYLNDGNTVTITDNGNGMYTAQHSATPGKNYVVSKEDLLNGTKDLFEGTDEWMAYEDMKEGRGPATSTVKGASDMTTGVGGKGASARQQDVYGYAQAMRSDPQYADYSDAELMVLSWNNILNKTGAITDRVKADMQMDLIKVLTQPNQYGQAGMTVSDAATQSQQIVDTLIKQWEENNAKGGADGVAGSTPPPGGNTDVVAPSQSAAPAATEGAAPAPLPQISQRWVDLLKQHADNPAAREQFDAQWGQGMAEQVLSQEAARTQ